MKYKIEKILSQFRKEIKVIEASDLNDFSNVEQGIRICQEHLQKLRLVLRESTFKNKQEEIKFFKEHKPHVYGRLKFYVKTYKFLMHRPMGSIKSQRNYIDSLIKKLQTDNQKNIDFVKYYREQSTLLDEFLFLRGKDKINLISDTSHFYTDSEFSTSHDNAAAKIIAYDLLLVYYVEELNRLKNNNTSNGGLIKSLKANNLNWTANKNDLVELIYALHTSGSINNGSIELREIAMACEKIFNIDLGNYYHTFVELRARKSNPTKYLDKLKELLLKRMSDSDF